jgi:hypothetical protein
MIKSRRMRWVGRVVYMRERTVAERVSVGILERRDHLEDLGVDGNLILMLSFHLLLAEYRGGQRLD